MPLKTAGKPSLESEFRSLAQRWKADCALVSSTSAMVSHPAYQAVIELGEGVVPFLLRELEQEPVHWFEALKAITKEDPVAPADRGKIAAMASAWLAWGRA